MGGETVKVSNISEILEEGHIRDLFACCGTIKSLVMRGSGAGRYSVITFDDATHAKAAVLLTGTPLGDRPLTVETFEGAVPAPEPETKKRTSASEVEAALAMVRSLGAMPGTGGMAASAIALEQQRRHDEIARTIYVGNLNPLLTETHIRQFFQTVGEVLYIKINKGTRQDDFRYCFVEFAKVEAAGAAVALSGTVLGDRALKVT